MQEKKFPSMNKRPEPDDVVLGIVATHNKNKQMLLDLLKIVEKRRGLVDLLHAVVENERVLLLLLSDFLKKGDVVELEAAKERSVR